MHDQVHDRLSERWYIDRQPVHPTRNRGGWYVRSESGRTVMYVDNRATIRQIVRDHNKVLKIEVKP